MKKILNSDMPLAAIIGLFIPIYYEDNKRWGYTIALGGLSFKTQMPLGWVMIIVAIIF